MGTRVNPETWQELADLDMKDLQSYVKDLDLKDINVFLENVFEAKENGSLTGEFTISLYEIVAKIHGVKIVPLIGNIMESIVKILGSSAVSFPIQQACSKVVPTIARYGIDLTTPEDEKRKIIHSLSKPLSDSLISSHESLNYGVALCLKALVDSDNWRFASHEMVNRVCQNLAVALDRKFSQTKSHMGLVMALAKRNALVVEAYARLLIQSGLRILNAGLAEGNSQKRLSAIKMVNFLMNCLDPRSIFSEIKLIIEEMEKCQDDKMAYVKGAAFEALQTAKRIENNQKARGMKSTGSVTGSNSSRGENVSGSASASPESQTSEYLPGDEFIVESPFSANTDYLKKNVARKVWRNGYEGVDVFLKDGLSSMIVQENAALERSLSNRKGDFMEAFDGFEDRRPRHGVSRSGTTSPQSSLTRVTVDGIEIFKNPRKLFDSVQYPNDGTLSCSQNGRFRSLSSGNNIQFSPTSNCDQNCFSDVNYDFYGNANESLCADVEFEVRSESVSSTDDLPIDADMQMMPFKEVVPENRNVTQTEKALKKTTFKLVCGLSFAVLAIATPLFWINNQNDGHYLVPT